MGIICADLYPVKVDQEPDMGMVCAGVLYPLSFKVGQDHGSFFYPEEVEPGAGSDQSAA